jgi:RNA polymerase sigma-70 factor (ECF subfamily)
LNRTDEQRLVAQAQRGNHEAFAVLYREHVQAIYRYVYHRVSDRQLAEDITGDVFTKAIEGLGRYQDTGNPFLAWLYRIAHDRVIDHYRKVNRQPTESDIEEQAIPVETDMDSGLVQEQLSKVLQAAIADLTSEQQQVVILRFIEGYRIEMVAGMMGKNANAIKALQHRALRALASRLERSGLDIESIMAGLT